MELHLVGGFLGSGKTTAIIEAAHQIISRGQRVGVITNEQGKHLVDTVFLHAEGIPALEVTGGCICCHLDDFADRIEEITEKFNPDFLFAESVGSCTDLVATVLKPLVDFRENSTQPASLSVFSDSRLLLRYLRGEELPFSDAVIYIFEKQIEETGLLIANKIDLLSEMDKRDLLRLAEKRYPNKTIRLQNSLDKKQVEGWLAFVQSQTLPVPQDSLDIDYTAYAAGEGLFAWLDCDLMIEFSDANQTIHIAELLSEIARTMGSTSNRIAHLKFFVSNGDNNNIRINLTSLDDLESKIPTQIIDPEKSVGNSVRLVINIMVEGKISNAEAMLEKTIQKFASDRNANIHESAQFSRTPGFPKPTRRLE